MTAGFRLLFWVSVINSSNEEKSFFFLYDLTYLDADLRV